MNKSYKSPIMAAVHESMEDLHDAGAIDKQTMRKFDDMCLTPVRAFTADDIRRLRARENLSQPVLARYLNVTKGLVSQWERGEKHPRGASLKLLALIESKGLDAVA
jgi:putative transcriptional regulator